MAVNPLNKKLLIKEGYVVGVINAPAGYEDMLMPLPDGASLAVGRGQFDCVICFVGSKAEVDFLTPTTLGSVKLGGLLWMCYPKGTSGAKTDINRDKGWDKIEAAGWRGVAQVAIDAKWTGTRFRPASEVKAGDKPKPAASNAKVSPAKAKTKKQQPNNTPKVR